MKQRFSWQVSAMILLGLALVVSCTGPQPTPPLSETLNVQVQPAQTGPQVLAQVPMAGQRLDLSAAIQLEFDRDMDTAQTGDSFALRGPDDEPVPGKLTWLDPRTLSFQPAKPLEPATTYTALIENAVGQDGSIAPEAIRVEFKTIESPAVAQVFPAPEAEDIDPATTITVIFNRPMVPLAMTKDQENLPQPLEISPAVTGKGEWLNSSVYVFQPEKPLVSGNRYTVRVDASLTDSSGNKLGEPFQWQFTIRPPLLGSYGLVDGPWNPKDSVKDVLLDQVFVVNFLQPMDADSVAQAVAIYNRETGQPFPIRLKWNDDFTRLRIEPQGRFELSGFYRLVVKETAQSLDGGHLVEGLNLPFETIGPPRIVNVYPDDADPPLTEHISCLYVDFASPMKASTIKSRVKVSPQLKDELQIYYYDYNHRLSVCGLQPATDYVVRLLPGMTDIYGNAIQSEYAFSFHNPDYAPYARLLLPWTPLVYRANGPQEVFFEYLNLDSAQLSVYSISYVEFSRLLESHPMAAFQPQSQPLRTWQIEGSAERNKLQYLNLKLEDSKGNRLPPGYYFIGLQAAPLEYDTPYYQGFAFIVATDNLTFKATLSEGLVWVTDLESGQPQPDVTVTFYNDKFIYLGKAKTDADGLAHLNATHPAYARVEGDGHLGFIGLDWGSGVWTKQFGISEDYYNNLPTTFAYLYTDRPLYRPGQEVFFKGIVRKNDDLHYTLPTNKSVYVRVQDGWGRQIYAQELPLSELGTFSGSFTLSDAAVLGTYFISVRSLADQPSFGQVSFRVAEYHKPEFQVNVTATPAQALLNEKVTFDLEATYYAGGQVTNAQVETLIESRPYIFVPPKEYRNFSFTSPDSAASIKGSYLLNAVTGVTDENGHLMITLPSLPKDAKFAQEITLSASVTDVGGNVVSGRGSVVLHPSQVYAGIRPQQFIGTAGEAQTFEVVAIDWDSQPVAGQEVSVQFIERKWYSVQEKDKQGQLRWVTSSKEIPIGTQKVVTDEKGLASVSFTPPNGGTFEARASVRDKKGNTHQASTRIWVTSSTAITWQQTNDRTFDVVANQAAYHVGDTAEILIAQPFMHEVYALVTVERGHIYHHEVLRLKDNSTIYRLPITAEMAPLIYVSVTVVSGVHGEEIADFKVGMTRLEVDTTQHALQVSIAADREISGPGRSVTYTITTKDAAGKPVQAEASLAVVDKAALALAPSNVEPILSGFYPQRALGVLTAVGLVSNAEKFNAHYRESIPEGGGSGGGSGGDESFGVVTVRQDFKDTAAFEALVMTDENGQAQVRVELPENLTTWQAEVHAVTADSKVGQATTEVLSTKPLFVELTTPRFFVVGDQARIGAIVHNTTEAAIEAEVELEAKGVRLDSGSRQRVQVEAKGQAYVTWDVTVQDVSRVDLTARVSGGGYQDASKPALGTLEGQGIPVYTFTTKETVGTSGMLHEAGSVTESVQLPRALDYSDASLSVQVEPSLAASLQSGLKYLEDFDYLCMEQTVSRFLPNVITARALQAAGLETSELQRGLDHQVNEALQRIYANQRYDGGWNWWSGNASDPYVTAYVLYGLLEARESGYAVTDDVLEAGLRYLKENLPTMGSGAENKDKLTWEYNRYAFMMYVLARGGELGAGDPNGLYEERAILSLYARAYLMQTLYLLDPQDERIASLLSDLGSAAVMSASGAHWEETETDYWNWNTDTRTTAIVLNAFIQVDPANPIIPQAVRWLMAHRSGGHWASTQETTWSLIALTNWLIESKEFETSYRYALGLNGKVLTQASVNRDNLTDTFDLQVGLKDLLKDEANYLVFTRGEGPGNLYYFAYLSTTLPVEQVQPLDQGISLSREYFTLDDDKTPITEIERGELVRVRLTMVVPAALHYVVIEDPLPAGLEAVDTSLETSLKVPNKYTHADYQQRGWGWWYFTHQEVRDEKVVLSTDYLPAGTYVYTYLARASTAGIFKVIPTTASEFYFPDVGGRGAGSVFVVKP